MKKYIQEYLFILDDQVKKLPVLISYFLVSSLLDILGISLVSAYLPILIGEVDSLPENIGRFFEIVRYQPETGYIYFGLAIILVYLLKGLASYSIQKRIIKFSLDVELWLKNRLMNRYLDRPYEFFLHDNSSNIVNTIGVYTSTFQTSTVSQSLKLMSEVIVVLFIGSLIFALNPYGLIFTFIMLSIFFIIYDKLIKKVMLKAGKVASMRFGEVIRNINQVVFGIKEIKIFGREEFFKNAVIEEVLTVNKARFTQDSLKLIPRYAIEFIVITIVILMAIVFTYMGQDRIEILTTIAVFVVAGTRLLPSANIIFTSLNTLRAGRYVVAEISKTLEETEKYNSNVHDAENQDNEISWDKEIEFRELSYKYPKQEKYIFKDVSLVIKKGESIGIVGGSGEGKTTLVNILLDLLQPEKGSILVDGRKLVGANRKIQSMMAYIPQKVFLLDDSIKNNIVFGINEDAIDSELLKESITKAKLDDLVKELPDGIETVIGENGIRFSGGQQQRIAIARALYSGRNILILDEATSALDTKTEREIVKEIDALKGKFTMVVIAHRISTLNGCNRIIEIKNGKLVNSR
jgi:ATP-binding cassette, subfamily B, bacterial PglK